MKPIYKFALNLETGEIKRIVIDNYEFIDNKHWTGGIKAQSYYRFRIGGTYYYAYTDDFDRYVNRRVYSWDDDLEKAKQIMMQVLLSNIEHFEKKEENCKRLVEILKGKQNGK